MKSEYYNRDQMSQIILALIHLHFEMKKSRNVDDQSLKDLLTTINNLQYYLQFLEPHSKEQIKYYKG